MEPITRKEKLLKAIADGTGIAGLDEPITREEQYLYQIAAGSGSGGTDNYNELLNLPQINNTTLTGNKTSADLGMYTADDVDELLDDKADLSDVYTKAQSDDTFMSKSDYEIRTEPTAAQITESINTIWGD